MKIVTAAAALEEGICTPQTPYNLPGTIQVGGYTIGEAHGRGTEMFTFSEIVERSSNIGAVTLGQALGKEKLYKYATKFGLNSPTGIESPGESQGYMPTPDQWSASTLATISFGQGISSTALESVRAVNVVASGGRLINPRVVQSVIDSNKRPRAINKKTEQGEQVISAGTAKTMAEILHRAVDEGTGKEARIKGYTVAGKTGTAQKPKKDAPGYDPGKYVSSFVGFTPAEDPAVTILVAIDEPQGMYYGGVVAAPVFSAVGEYALQRLQIVP
jgi:cell division protein FtsI/penicillin-binding protein 2